jgi:hypothetical protein
MRFFCNSSFLFIVHSLFSLVADYKPGKQKKKDTPFAGNILLG